MRRRTWAVFLVLAGAVLLIGAFVASLTDVSSDEAGCGSVIAPVHNANARIDRVCDSERSDRSSAVWVLGVGGLAVLGAGAGVAWRGSRRH